MKQENGAAQMDCTVTYMPTALRQLWVKGLAFLAYVANRATPNGVTITDQIAHA